MRKVVITGINGFIGNHMAQKCIQAGYKVVGIDINSTSNIDTIEYYQLNLMNDSIDSILEKHFPFILIHCAGMADVNYSMQYPDSDFATNVVVTRKILYSVKNHSENTIVIFLSSASVYGNPINLPISEKDKKNPISPYALHKVISENICEYFVKQHNIDIRILRIFSAYGIGLKKQIFWDMGQKIKKYNKLELFGTGQETRDFIYIDDLVNAIQLVMESEREEEAIYNIANGNEISIKNVAEIFIEKCGLGKELILFNNIVRPGNPQCWCADIHKIKKLGYKPEINIHIGIEKYVEWIRSLGII